MAKRVSFPENKEISLDFHPPPQDPPSDADGDWLDSEIAVGDLGRYPDPTKSREEEDERLREFGGPSHYGGMPDEDWDDGDRQDYDRPQALTQERSLAPDGSPSNREWDHAQEWRMKLDRLDSARQQLLGAQTTTSDHGRDRVVYGLTQQWKPPDQSARLSAERARAARMSDGAWDDDLKNFLAKYGANLPQESPPEGAREADAPRTAEEERQMESAMELGPQADAALELGTDGFGHDFPLDETRPGADLVAPSSVAAAAELREAEPREAEVPLPGGNSWSAGAPEWPQLAESFRARIAALAPEERQQMAASFLEDLGLPVPAAPAVAEAPPSQPEPVKEYFTPTAPEGRRGSTGSRRGSASGRRNSAERRGSRKHSLLGGIVSEMDDPDVPVDYQVTRRLSQQLEALGIQETDPRLGFGGDGLVFTELQTADAPPLVPALVGELGDTYTPPPPDASEAASLEEGEDAAVYVPVEEVDPFSRYNDDPDPVDLFVSDRIPGPGEEVPADLVSLFPAIPEAVELEREAEPQPVTEVAIALSATKAPVAREPIPPPVLGEPDEWKRVMVRKKKHDADAPKAEAKPQTASSGEPWYPAGWVDPLKDKVPLTAEEREALKEKQTWKPFHALNAVPQRDLLVDLRRHRARTLAEGATQDSAPVGPVWPHLAAKAKNLAGVFTMDELVEVTKNFASVRLGDTELYLALLGEIPRHLSEAPAASACEVIRILARLRLRERSYVDMLSTHLMPYMRAAADTVIPARLFVQTGNALAALDVRTNSKFVLSFLRHFQFRIYEFNAELIELFSPLFVVQYMNDEARKVFLLRAAEVQAGFHGRPESVRNLTLIEFALRKEHHSCIASLPSFVPRYLDKIRQLATVHPSECLFIPKPPVSHKAVYQDGSRSQSQQFQLRAKVSSAHDQLPKLPGTAAASVNVFSSSLHQDVSACLDHLGLAHENGVPAGPFLLDIVARNAEFPDHRIIYEIDTKSDYYLGTQMLTAEKKFRHQLLARLGYNGTHIAHHDWQHLSPAHRAQYLLQLQMKASERGSATRRAQGQRSQSLQPRQRAVPAARQELAAKTASPLKSRKLPEVPRIGLPELERRDPS